MAVDKGSIIACNAFKTGGFVPRKSEKTERVYVYIYSRRFSDARHLLSE